MNEELKFAPAFYLVLRHNINKVEIIPWTFKNKSWRGKSLLLKNVEQNFLKTI